MRRALSFAICGLGALLAAACSSSGVSFGSSPAPAQPPAENASTLPTGAALGGILGGPVGAQLDEADRQAAYDAQVAALETGQKRTWRGAHGAYGFVEPGPGADNSAPVACRTYAQTIYIAGRPQRGHGQGCRQPDGSWRMAS